MSDDMTDRQRMTLTVCERFDDRGDIARIRLVGDDLPPVDAGAHLDIHLPEVGLWRQYSVCSDPGDRSHYEIGVLKDPASRGGSVEMHRVGVVGARLTVEGPRNHFPLNEEAGLSVLIGGGIGITPMIAMAKRLHHLGRDFVLHYCTRSQGVTAFYDDLLSAPFADRVVLHHDDEAEAQKLDLARDLPHPDPDTHLYVCGPQGFMDWVIGGAEAQGHGAANIHREYFSADVELSGDSFEVEARASGLTLTVGPNDTIAKKLADHGIKVEVKCEEGVCGTCITDVIEGDIDHRDQFLTEDEREDGDQICVCCSRARGLLVLDL